MIQVSPQIKLKPFQHAGQVYVPRALHLAGMRMLIEAQSESGHVLWKDFPSSHGLYAPCLCDPSSRAVYSLPNMGWWSDPMPRIFEQAKEAASLRIHERRTASSWIILNTLDNIFGHSLLLLLNAQFYLDQFPERGLIVIATPELLPYIPNDVHAIWELKVKPADTEKFQTILDINFKKLCAQYDVSIATAPSHPDPGRYDLSRFNIPRAEAPGNPGAPRIVFIHRGTRLWGGSWESERGRLEKLASWLSRFWPKARLEIYGHARLPHAPEGWRDATRNGEANYDAILLEALARADLVIGAHGSSMLLPSAICGLVLELVPLDKQPSLLQDFLFDRATGVRQQLWRRRFLYGNSMLSDVSPRQVAQLINAMISMRAQFEFYQTASTSDPLRDPAQVEQDFAEKIAPQLQMFQANLEKTLDLPAGARFWNFLRRAAGGRD